MYPDADPDSTANVTMYQPEKANNLGMVRNVVRVRDFEKWPHS